MEEDRLWNGKIYANLPTKKEHEDCNNDAEASHPVNGLIKVESAVEEAGDPAPRPYRAAGPPEEKLGTGTYLDSLRAQQHDAVQQMESQNRFKLLESQTPDHNLTARRHKLDLAVDKSQPKVFYDHENKYQSERVGVYKTSYDPLVLQQKIKGDDYDGAPLFDTFESHIEALDDPPRGLNQDMNQLMGYNRTVGVPGGVAQLHGQPTPFEALQPFREVKRQQEERLQPETEVASVKVQENGITLTESTYGEGYGTSKFLQERSISKMQRNEPLNLMSAGNQNLEPVRVASLPKMAKNVQFASAIRVRTNEEQLRHASAPTGQSKPEVEYRAAKSEYLPTMVLTHRPGSHPTVTYIKGSPSTATSGGLETRHSSPSLAQFQNLPVPLEKTRYSYSISRDDQFTSKSSNLMPSGLRQSWAGQSAYSSQYNPNRASYVDMATKNDARFNWKAGSGRPRPQSILLAIQDSFTKTDARNRFNERFPEKNPDIRENIISGKKHEFNGLNAQILRGTPVA